MACSVLPDADSIGLRFGIPYGHLFGHRGFSHSLSFAVLCGVVAALAAPLLRSHPGTTFAVVFFSTASHGVLDAMTSGGLGIAFFSPFSNHRYFLPWRPIQVSPLSISAFFSSWGVRVVMSELTFIWLPCMLVGSLGAWFRAIRRGA